MFSWKRILPHVYHLHFDSGYDLAMHFIRVQEFYESPRFYRKIFTLVDYMEWYSKEYGKGAFTYPTDWSGFNVPSNVLLEVYKSSTNVPDFNKYDSFMSALIAQAAYLEQGQPFYFIGTSSSGYKGDADEEDVLDHELAHALYYTNRAYRDAMVTCLFHMDSEAKYKASQALAKMGYHFSTIEDEIHAYSATGVCSSLQEILTSQVIAPFQKVFQEFKVG